MGAAAFVPADWREWRRPRALQLERQGWRQRAIALALGVREEAVCRRLARAASDGPEPLRARPAPGRPPRPPRRQKGLIPEPPWRGAGAYGFTGEVRTRARVAPVIQEGLGALYHRGHAGGPPKGLRRAPQMPIRRAIRRDEPAIRRWRDEARPEPLEKARGGRRALVFEGEPGSYLPPGPVRTYAPEARAPVTREEQARDHPSVLGGVTPRGKVCAPVRREPPDGPHRVGPLGHLRAVTGRRPLVIWDGSPIHRRVAVRGLADQSKGRPVVGQLPGHAPDLSPWDEGGWHHPEDVQMRNPVTHDLEGPHERSHLAVERLRQKPDVARSFFARAGLTPAKT